MSEPVVAAKLPAVLELDAGTYWWCQCGLSKNQPFCDGAHKGGSFAPLKVVLDKPQRVALCQCKHTAKPPFCDGSHGKLP